LTPRWKSQFKLPETTKENVPSIETLEEVVAKLRGELEVAETELQQYRCPHCGAPLFSRCNSWVSDRQMGIRSDFPGQISSTGIQKTTLQAQQKTRSSARQIFLSVISSIGQ
jgi:predicted RNA-binding Zn-ribbon protein involved in translation (DUF1610 family)